VNWNEFYAAQLEREAPATRRALERVPEGKPDWKPHERSMPLGYLAQLVATMPGWIATMIERDELDLNPPGGGEKPPDTGTREKLLAALDDSVAGSVTALRGTTDAHLETRWRLLVGGRVVMEDSRRQMIAETLMHFAHHRGQLTVYLRLNEEQVPAIYGPSADERAF